MRTSHVTVAIVALATIIISLLIMCGVPADPFDKSKTKVSLVLKSSDGQQSQVAITDTIGATDSIIVSIDLAQHFDSIIVTVELNSVKVDSFKFDDTTSIYATAEYGVKFLKAGNYQVNVIGYVDGLPNREIHGQISIVDRTEENRAPGISIRGRHVVTAGNRAILIVTGTDPNPGQTASVVASRHPDDATFNADTFSWVTTLADVGTHTVVFIASDNGNPVMSARDSIAITVTATAVNEPPAWSSDTIALYGRPGAQTSLSFGNDCNDADGDSIEYLLVTGLPEGDAISGAKWSYTPGAGDVGIYYPKIVATDPSGEADTLIIELTIATEDRTSPVMKLIAPALDSQTISASSFTVKISCVDQSGVEEVKCSIGSKTFEVTTSSDTVYSATITNLVSGFNTIQFIATDKSPAANQETLFVTLNYDADAPDNVAPTITLVAPSKDTLIGQDSCEISVQCVDESGIAEVTIGGVTASRENDDVFTATVKDLSGGKNTITIVATDSAATPNVDSTSVIVEYDNDAEGPEVTLVTPDKDSVTTNSTGYTILLRATDESGVLSVRGTLGSETFTGARDTGKVWKLSVTGLVANEVTTIILTVIDSSLHANKTRDTVYITSEIINGHTVTFNKNDTAATGTMEAQTMSSGVKTALAANAFVKEGWTFAGWATSATGAVEFADGADYTIDASNVTLYAVWSETTHKVTFNKNDATATGTMAVQNIAEGAEATLSANAFVKAGSSFTGWATSATGAVVYADAASYTMGTGDVVLYAKWSANTHKVTFDKNDAAATGTMAVQNIEEGAEATLSVNAFVKVGSSFTGWATSATGAIVYADAASYTMGTEDVVLYAKWGAKTHKVTFDKNDAAATGTMTVQNIAEGTAALLSASAFVKAGSSFAGWATSATGAVAYADAVSYTMGTVDVTLYAKWAANTHKVTFDKNDAAATGTMTVQSIAEGTAAPLSANAFVKAGSSFTGWATSVTGAVAYADAASYTMGTADVTLYAKWAANTHKVTFDKNDAAATGTMVVQNIAEGTAAPLSANAFVKTGSSFSGWATSATGAVVYPEAASYTMGTADVTLYAKWAVNTHTVAFNKNDAAATGTMANQTIAEGASAPLTANAFAKTGSSFAGWATSASGAAVYANLASYPMGTANVTLYAKWTVNTHTVTFDKNDAAATGTMATQTIAEGASDLLTANAFAKTGSSFAGWATSATGAIIYTDEDNYAMGTANVTLFAKWAVNTHAVTFNKNDAGATGTMANQTIAEGASANLTANGFTKTGSSFAGWATSASGAVAYANQASYPMGTANVTLYAKWTVNTHTVTFNNNDALATGTMGTQTIAEGATTPLTANGFSKAGWAFNGWATSASGTAIYADGDDYTMGSADVTLYAKWSANSFAVIFNKNDAAATGSMTNQSILSGSSMPLKPNSFVKSGWTFAGWATSSNGSKVYDDQASIAMGTANVTLYAKWTANFYRITFEMNNADAGGVMSAQSIASGSSATLRANSFWDYCRTFVGWATTPGGAAQYSNQGSYSMGTSDVTLYAKWSVTPINVTLAAGTTAEHCVFDPITCTNNNSGCATYQWYFQAFGGPTLITPEMGEWTGCTTNTLTIDAGGAGMNIYCIITDIAGNQVTTGTWQCGSAYCP